MRAGSNLIVSIVLFGFLKIALADSPVEFKVVKSSNGQTKLESSFKDGSKFVMELETIPKHTKFFHWTSSKQRVDSWTLKNEVPAEEMKSRLNSGSGTSGGGVYVSEDSVDSSSYGNQLIVFEPKVDLLTLSWMDRLTLLKHIKPRPGEPVDDNLLNQKLAKAGVSVSRHPKNGEPDRYGQPTNKNRPFWMGLIGQDAVSSLHVGTLDEVMANWKSEKTLPDLVRIDISMGGIKPHLLVKKEFPLIDKILNSIPLQEIERAQLEKQYYELRGYCISAFDCKKSKLYAAIEKAVLLPIDEGAPAKSYPPVHSEN